MISFNDGFFPKRTGRKQVYYVRCYNTDDDDDVFSSFSLHPVQNRLRGYSLKNAAIDPAALLFIHLFKFPGRLL